MKREAVSQRGSQTGLRANIRRTYRQAPREALFAGEKDLAAAYRRLRHAGFPSGQIVRARSKRFAGNPELLDHFEPPEESADET